MLNTSKADRKTAEKAKQAAKKFGEFAKWCVDNDMVLEAGIGDMPFVGTSSFINIIDSEGTSLVILTVPHELIDVITGEDNAEVS